MSDKRARTIIAARLSRLAAGLVGDIEPIGEGLSELRIHYGPGYRIYFIRRGDRLVILLCGGAKSTQSRDITVALKMAREWKQSDD